MTAAVAGGYNLAQKVPHVSLKLATVAGSVLIGAGAIIEKNVAGNYSEELGKDLGK